MYLVERVYKSGKGQGGNALQAVWIILYKLYRYHTSFLPVCISHSFSTQKTIRDQLEKRAWKVLTNVSEGVDAAPGGYASLYRGENFGKSVVKIAV